MCSPLKSPPPLWPRAGRGARARHFVNSVALCAHTPSQACEDMGPQLDRRVHPLDTSRGDCDHGEMTIPQQVPQLINAYAGKIVIDYGHFEVFDPQAFPPEVTDLLGLAQASPPSFSADGMAVILSPHQNNFDTSVAIEVWSARPDDDRDRWEQISENVFRVESGELFVGESLGAAAAPDTYILQVSGRGFVGYGWPGSTEPGDEWRLRLWPARTDPGGARAPQQWSQPGFGVPDPVPFRPENTTGDSIDVEEPGSQGPIRETSAWDSVPGELYHVNGAVELNRMDPELVARLISLPATRQREIAWWCAHRALKWTSLDPEWAGLDTEDYVIKTIAQIEAGAPPPDFEELFNWLDTWLDERNLDGQDSAASSGQGTWTRTVLTPDQHPYEMGEVSRPHFALPTIVTAANSDPLHAVIETLSHACSTYSDHAPSLIEQLKTEFDLTEE